METTEIKKFDKAKAVVENRILECNSISVADDLQLQVAEMTLKDAKLAVKLIEERREELVRPHIDAQKGINNYARTLTVPLESAITVLKNKVLNYTHEKERKRLAEIRKIEEERKAKAEAERLERERVDRLKNKLSLFENQSIKAINGCTSLEMLESVRNSLRMYSVTGFQEFTMEATDLKSSLLDKCSDHKMFLEKQIAIKEEAARLDGIAKEQAELKAKQEQEARKLQEEADRLVREQQRLEREKADAEAKKQQEIEAAIKDQEDKKRLKELEAEKAKNVRKNWVFEVLDENSIPREYLKVDEAKINEAIKSGARNIPGISIFQKESIVVR